MGGCFRSTAFFLGALRLTIFVWKLRETRMTVEPVRRGNLRREIRVRNRGLTAPARLPIGNAWDYFGGLAFPTP